MTTEHSVTWSPSNVQRPTSNVDLYIGTYTDRPANPDRTSRGIYLGRFDPVTGLLSEPVLAAPAHTPSFLALDPSQRYLYAVSEYGESELHDADGIPYGL